MPSRWEVLGSHGRGPSHRQAPISPARSLTSCTSASPASMSPDLRPRRPPRVSRAFSSTSAGACTHPGVLHGALGGLEGFSAVLACAASTSWRHWRARRACHLGRRQPSRTSSWAVASSCHPVAPRAPTASMRRERWSSTSARLGSPSRSTVARRLVDLRRARPPSLPAEPASRRRPAEHVAVSRSARRVGPLRPAARAGARGSEGPPRRVRRGLRGGGRHGLRTAAGRARGRAPRTSGRPGRGRRGPRRRRAWERPPVPGVPMCRRERSPGSRSSPTASRTRAWRKRSRPFVRDQHLALAASRSAARGAPRRAGHRGEQPSGTPRWSGPRRPSGARGGPRRRALDAHEEQIAQRGGEAGVAPPWAAPASSSTKNALPSDRSNTRSTTGPAGSEGDPGDLHGDFGARETRQFDTAYAARAARARSSNGRSGGGGASPRLRYVATISTRRRAERTEEERDEVAGRPVGPVEVLEEETTGRPPPETRVAPRASSNRRRGLRPSSCAPAGRVRCRVRAAAGRAPLLACPGAVELRRARWWRRGPACGGERGERHPVAADSTQPPIQDPRRSAATGRRRGVLDEPGLSDARLTAASTTPARPWRHGRARRSARPVHRPGRRRPD